MNLLKSSILTFFMLCSAMAMTDNNNKSEIEVSRKVGSFYSTTAKLK